MEPHGQVGGESQRPDHGGPGQNQQSQRSISDWTKNSTPVRSIDVHYIPTEDERRIFKECNEESFWYRSVPLSAISMLVTQMLIKKGTLTAHSRFGSLPKVAFAGLCGYIGGKLSYMKACQEKFRRSENSPLGEALRQRRPISPEYYSQKQEFSNVPSSSPFEMPPVTEAPPSSMYSGDNRRLEYSDSEYEPVPFSSSMNESTPTGITDSVPQEPVPSLEASSKRKGITYDELRSRNREMYEAGVTQKSELPPKSSHERISKKEGKVNKYGDAWEE